VFVAMFKLLSMDCRLNGYVADYYPRFSPRFDQSFVHRRAQSSMNRCCLALPGAEWTHSRLLPRDVAPFPSGCVF
jgi:hypothetical protein